ncbi:hypothetical protein LZ575_01160 [Antarcticibacterium sp. 1MA-6-2]|uniref:TlpA family protein disulfide reductase n=1 Tax=Antarcticibacterium sp. 1MA-6-2 TaxID=2908210 RepID=UPI001F244117|nr:redoxin domain-containing protein [Antarcticibacterium sp. 1MA-6-2]UJH91424.1 hypothetical protein LZ575_01160 [Antarcticibacterium sp. 1MA-6-2]
MRILLETQEFALTDLLNTYTFNLLPSNIEILKLKVSEYKTKFTNDNYRNKLGEIERKLSLSNNKLPDSILNLNLISLDDHDLQIKDLLTSNTVVVIDVWATWCYWCFFDMEEAKDFKEELIDQGKVEWIYVSIDKQKDSLKWKNISETKKDLGLNKNQYLLDENDYSKFSKFFDTDAGIPKYLIFNKEGFLVLPNSPRPTDSAFFGKAISQLN